MAKKLKNKFTSLEICAGAGGQALGLEQSGFEHVALVEIEELACQTLLHNRPEWNVINQNVKKFSATKFKGKVDLFAGGVPCPPFSKAGRQLGEEDDRDLFPEALRLIRECEPEAVLLENVRGLLDPKFQSYREVILDELTSLGYNGSWRILNASDYGVPQLRPRAILIALKTKYVPYFKWPSPCNTPPPTVGEILVEEMGSLGWKLAESWSQLANGIAPTLVGGSKKHGGADLGPTRAKAKWASMSVDGGGLANSAPDADSTNMKPKLTLGMTALIQGFPKEWHFVGKKTPAYRQVGNAFPPQVAKALGKSIIEAFREYEVNNKVKWQKQKEAKAANTSCEPTLFQK